MINKLTNLTIYLLLILILFCKCNKESFVENQGAISNIVGNPSNYTGRVVFYTTNFNIGFCISGLKISVDGVEIGTLTNTNSGTPLCGTNSDKAISATLKTGLHSCSIRGTGASCPKYTFNFTINKDVCLQQELQ